MRLMSEPCSVGRVPVNVSLWQALVFLANWLEEEKKVSLGGLLRRRRRVPMQPIRLMMVALLVSKSLKLETDWASLIDDRTSMQYTQLLFNHKTGESNTCRDDGSSPRRCHRSSPVEALGRCCALSPTMAAVAS